MRYFAELSYLGTNYHGWQRQPNGISVQQVIEEGLSTILRADIPITGCGRTDTGVHSSQYFIHFDFDGTFPQRFTRRINKFLPQDIAIRRFIEVHDDAHSRFDAEKRSYQYHIDLYKNPFRTNLAWYYYIANELDVGRMDEAAELLKQYEEFAPFCKTNNDAKTMKCDLYRAEWEIDENAEQLIFHISANRFLRGMVRLIVGACINIGEGKIKLDTLKKAMDNQTILEKSLSVPPQGLYLSEISYPYIENTNTQL
ncbi:MAG: tRNA pseudouridine(38-40) synthase TruA [Bacteroidota bacterium]